MPRPRASEAGALRLYRGCLRLYPSAFREEYGNELCFAFADLWREERSAAGQFAVWLRALAGILQEAPQEHYHMIMQDLRYSVRSLRKDAGMTAAAIAILALGIGAATLVFSLAHGLLLRPLPYPEPRRIVAVDEFSPTDPNETGDINFLNYLDIRARSRLLEDIGLFGGDDAPIRGEGEAERVLSGVVTDGFFTVIGLRPVAGRLFTRDDMLPGSPRVAILGEELWERRYGRDLHILGRDLQIGDQPWRVVGILPREFHYPGRAELWRPLRVDPARAARTDYGLHGMARLKPGVSIGQANAELRLLLDRIHQEHPEANNHWGIRARPLREFMAGEFEPAVLMLLAAVAVLLAIACANVSNLLLVKASARSREMALRTAIGATRARLVRQLLSESLLIGGAGGALGIALAYLGVPALLSLIPIELPRWMNFKVDAPVLAFAVAVSLLTSIAFGLAPALGSSSVHLADALKAAGRGGGTGRRQKLLRNSLVVAEVSLSVMLLAGAGLMIRSFVVLRTQNLGYRPENVLTLEIDYPEQRYPDGPPARALLQQVEREVSSLPAVRSLVFTTGVPLHDSWTRIFTIEGQPRDLKDMPFVHHVVTAPGYFHVLGLPLLRGRDFTPSDYDSPYILIVSQAFANLHWPGEDPLGKRIRFGPPSRNEPWHTVVGVAADDRHGNLKSDDRATVYLPYSARITPASLVIRTAADPATVVSAVRARITAVDHDIAVGSVLTLGQIIDRAAWQDRFLMVLFAVFAALALGLAAVGLYAVISYTVSLEAHSIGIRMALGASAAEVRAMVLRQGLTLAAAGMAVGIGAALLLTRLLKTQLYQVSPMDPAAFVIASAVLLSAAAIAAYLPSRRATRVDPAVALRAESL